MSKPSGTSNEILNLPSGGGSVSGAGSDFGVDLNTGTATARFDLVLPAGPNATTPPISLTYSSTTGDGPFGLGWALGLLTIRRKISPTADPKDLTGAGTFSLDGVGGLVDMGNGRFRPTVDTTGHLIEFVNGSWSLTDKSDTTSTLGTTDNSRIGSNQPAAWLLDGTTDSSGNVIAYQWLEDGAARLLQKVTWGTYQLVFDYEARPDLLINGTYGATVTISKRCSSIELHVTTEQQTLVRSWKLIYFDRSGRGRSQLQTIREQGHAADGSILVAPDRTFVYADFGTPGLLPVTGWTESLLDKNVDLLDLNGDGLPDILRLGAGLPTMNRNLGGGTFGPPKVLARAPAPFRLSSDNVAFANMTGAGNADLLVLGDRLGGYYPLFVPPGGSGPSEFGSPVVFKQAPRIVPADPHVRLVDLNSDGMSDVLIDTGRAWLIYFRDETDGWTNTPRVLPPERTPPVSLLDPHVFLADMTGDGQIDVVHIDGGGIAYWPARADGGWDAPVRMTPSPVFDQNLEPARLNLIDIDGDGCADLVYVKPTSVIFWRNIGAGRLADPVTISNTPLCRPGSYRIIDLLGNGTAGIYFELPRWNSDRARQVFLDFSGGIKPYLLTDLSHGPFQSTHVSYKTSTEFAREDEAAGTPWQTYHPFPIQCVARSDQTDHATGIVSTVEYRYHDGHYDSDNRVFLGFGRVESDQIGDKTCPTLRVQTVYHLGLDPTNPARPLQGDEQLKLGALRRKVLHMSVFGLDGSPVESKPYSVAVHTYDTLLVPSTSGNGDKVAVPHVVSSTEQRWERQDAVVSTRVIRYLGINEEGDITSQRTIAQRTGLTTPDQDITTTTTFATGGKNVRLPARVTQTGPDGAVTSATVYFYDGEAFVGLPEGQATQGLLSRVETLAFDNGFMTSIWGTNPPDLTTFGYHRLPGDTTGWWLTRRAIQRTSGAPGPVLSTKGPLGGTQHVHLDPAGQQVAAVTDALGNTMTATINARVWQIESLTDPNGKTTQDQFDALGRVIGTFGPLDSPALPWSSFAYMTGSVSVINAAVRVNHLGTEVVPANTWLDGTGRILGKATPGAAAGEWIVSLATQRNVRGLTISEFLPYVVTGTGWQAPPTGTASKKSFYDALGRIVQSTRPDGLVINTRREGGTLIISEVWPGFAAADVERQEFDAAGQLISVSRNAGDHWVVQTYAYAPSGKVSTVTLPGGGQVSFVHDLLGRRFCHASADAGRTVSLLDASGNERLRTNAVGQTIRSEFDLLSRIKAVFHDADTNPRVKYDYFDHGGVTPADGITANRAARLWRINDELGTQVFQYDEMGRTTNTTRTVAATSQSFIQEKTFDGLGRVVSISLPSTTQGAGRRVQYGYGPDGRLTSASGIIKQAGYDVLGRMSTITYQNGASMLLDYRANGGGLQRLRVLDAAGAVIRDTTVAMSKGLVSGVSSAAAGDDNVTFAYDGLQRLTAANYAQGAQPTDSHDWSFDDSFALIASADSGPLTYKAGTHQTSSVAGRATIFDSAGRLTSGRFGTLAFDAADHLMSVTRPDGKQISHTYDYRGLRSRSVSAGAQTYLRPFANIEIQGSTSITWISFGEQRVAADVGGELWFLHPNAVGATDLITDPTGKLATRIRQTPFGLTRPSSSSRAASIVAAISILLIGADETGLVCQGVRRYDPLIGQFISPDPMITGIFVIGAWNPYVFCLGNPIALCDPSGASFWGVMAIIGIAVFAAVCVVGAVFTGGATLFGLAAMTSTSALTLMGGVAVGSLGGAIAGELAAQKAGGNLWAGAFVGALLGGTTSLAGGALGGLASTAVDGAFGVAAGATTHTLLAFVASGAIQGTLAGAGTGFAIGFAGGKGSLPHALLSAAQGAMWGAALGAFLGLGTGIILSSGAHLFSIENSALGTQIPDKYANTADFYKKFLDSSSFVNALNAGDNQWGVGLSAAQTAAPGGFTAQNVVGFLPNLFTTNVDQGGITALSLPISGVGAVLVANTGFAAGFSAAVTLSMAVDQAGFSYAHQVSELLGAASYFIDFAVQLYQFTNPKAFDQDEVAFNKAFGSSSPNNTG